MLQAMLRRDELIQRQKLACSVLAGDEARSLASPSPSPVKSTIGNAMCMCHVQCDAAGAIAITPTHIALPIVLLSAGFYVWRQRRVLDMFPDGATKSSCLLGLTDLAVVLSRSDLLRHREHRQSGDARAQEHTS